MKKVQITRLATITLIAVSVALFAAYRRVEAQGHTTSSQLPIMGQSASSTGLTGGGHVLDATLFNWGNDDSVPINPGYQPVDTPTKITCGHPNGCTIGFEQHVQLGGNSTANNEWGICTFVDGNYIHTPGCPFQGNLPTDLSNTVGAFAQQTSVTFGPHVVQTFVYTTGGAQLDTYNIIYRVYHP
jgi:hypothetical protein